MRTASCRNRDRLPIPSSFNKVPTRRRHAGEHRLSVRDVDRLELSAPSVVENLRPCVLGLADNDRVGIAQRLVRKSGRMRSANDNRHAAAAKFPGEAIGVKSGRGWGRDPDEVGRDVESHRLHDFIGVRNKMLRWRERGDQWHRQLRKLDQAAIPQPPRLRRLAVIR